MLIKNQHVTEPKNPTVQVEIFWITAEGRVKNYLKVLQSHY